MHTLEEQLALEEYYKNYAREAFRIRIKKEIEEPEEIKRQWQKVS